MMIPKVFNDSQHFVRNTLHLQVVFKQINIMGRTTLLKDVREVSIMAQLFFIFVTLAALSVTKAATLNPYSSDYFQSAHFSTKCARLLQCVVFFRRVRSTFLFICSTTSNLNNFKPQQLQTPTTPTSEARPKRKEKTKQTSKDPTLAPLFSTLCDFFEVFWIASEGPPFICFDILQHNGCQKIAKGPPCTFFGTVTLFKNLIQKIFSGNFFMSAKGPPFIFKKFFATSWSFTKPEGSPF